MGLCGRLWKAAELERGLAADADLHLLVANSGRRAPVFLAALVLDVARMPWASKVAAARAFAARRLKVTWRDLHDQRVLAILRGLAPDVGLHAAGAIYRKPLLECFRLGVLNPHIGLLPEYRGRSVMEWSLLQGDPTGITTFFVDEGIDTGPRMVLRREVDVSRFDDVESAKAYLFSLDVSMFSEALDLLGDPGFEPTLQDVGEGRRYYAMSALLSGVVEEILRRA